MILSIQYLRGIAAMMVVYLHAVEQLRRISGPTAANFHGELGAAGVDIFFVISGFIMWVTTADDRTTPGMFVRKRLVRVVPIYWLLTLFIAAVALAAPSLVSSTRFDAAHLLASLGFVPSPHPVLAKPYPVLIPGWTLNYEMAFYALFALALFLPKPSRLWAILAALAGAVLAGRLVRGSGAVAFYSDPIVLEFGAGALIGALFRSSWTVLHRVAAGVGLLGLAALLAGFGSGLDLHRLVLAGVPAALIVFGLAFYEKARPAPDLAPVRIVGDGSYSIYLTHVIALPILTKAWEIAGLGAGGGLSVIFILTGLLASALAGIAFYGLVEQPLALALRSRTSSREALGGASI